jgi:hypothetical protein
VRETFMGKRPSQRLVVSALVLIAMVWWSPRALLGGDRHAGTVLTVDAPAGALILEEYWINGRRRELPVRITSRTRVMLSERNESPRDLTDTFVTTSISVDDLKIGDFVVVELAGAGPLSFADLVTVTLRAGGGS